MAIKLGTKVKDSITGFAGIAVSRTSYLYGCVRIGVEPTSLIDNKLGEIQYFDEQRLDKQSTAESGGDGKVPPLRGVPK